MGAHSAPARPLSMTAMLTLAAAYPAALTVAIVVALHVAPWAGALIVLACMAASIALGIRARRADADRARRALSAQAAASAAAFAATSTPVSARS